MKDRRSTARIKRECGVTFDLSLTRIYEIEQPAVLAFDTDEFQETQECNSDEEQPSLLPVTRRVPKPLAVYRDKESEQDDEQSTQAHDSPAGSLGGSLDDTVTGGWSDEEDCAGLVHTYSEGDSASSSSLLRFRQGGSHHSSEPMKRAGWSAVHFKIHPCPSGLCNMQFISRCVPCLNSLT